MIVSAEALDKLLREITNAFFFGLVVPKPHFRNCVIGPFKLDRKTGEVVSCALQEAASFVRVPASGGVGNKLCERGLAGALLPND